MLNHIELAKECCDYETDDDIFEFTHDQLAAFANAIVEGCAKVADRMPMNTAEEYNGYRSSDDCKAMAWDIQNSIRALKVKG